MGQAGANTRTDLVLAPGVRVTGAKSRGQGFERPLSPPHSGAWELPQFPCRRQAFERPLSPPPSRSAASVSPRSLGTATEGLGTSGPRGFLPFSGSCKDAPALEAERGSEAAGEWERPSVGDAEPRT